MRRKAIVTIVGLALFGALAMARPAITNTEIASKAEDDFQLVKVADGVFAAIAKSGGLASGNAGFIVGDSGVLVVDTFFMRFQRHGRQMMPVIHAPENLGCGRGIVSDKRTPIHALNGHAVVVLCVEPN